MAPHAALNTADIAEKARRDLLQLLEGVSKAASAACSTLTLPTG